MRTEITKLVTFRLGEDLFAADIFDVERVLRYQPPTTVPDMPEWMDGMIEYQKRVVPVIDLRRRFELPEPQIRPETRILVLNGGGEWVGAIVDAVIEVSVVPEGQLSQPPAIFRGLAGDLLKGVVRTGDRLIVVFDVQRLFSSTERLALERTAAAADARA